MGAQSLGGLSMVRVDARVRRLTRLFGLFAVIFIVSLWLTPWRQSVAGSGRVIAQSATERVQDLEAPLSGRIGRWYVGEGTHVNVGDPLVDIVDNDPSYLARLAQQRLAAVKRVDAARAVVSINEARIIALHAARSAAVAGAQQRVGLAREQLMVVERALEAAVAAHTTADLNLRRQRGLDREGLVADRDVELAELAFQTTRSRHDAIRAEVRASRRGISAARTKLSYVVSTEDANIRGAEVALQKHRVDLAVAQGEMEKAKSTYSRQATMKVTAPVAGTVVHIVANGDGYYVKQGEGLARIVPDATLPVVEMWIAGKDVPLITRGRKVRLQFQGWPAVQFVGWPSFAAGTFGGRVAFLDATDDGSGRVRVVVAPDPGDEPWPEAPRLRQGSRAHGWVLLNEVSVAFEVWRQLNGFQPVVDAPPSPPLRGAADLLDR